MFRPSACVYIWPLTQSRTDILWRYTMKEYIGSCLLLPYLLDFIEIWFEWQRVCVHVADASWDLAKNVFSSNDNFEIDSLSLMTRFPALYATVPRNWGDTLRIYLSGLSTKRVWVSQHNTCCNNYSRHSNKHSGHPVPESQNGPVHRLKRQQQTTTFRLRTGHCRLLHTCAD